MYKQKFLIFSLIVLIFVAIFNYIGIKYNLYWVYKWYDIPMHFFAGLSVGLFSLFLYQHYFKDVAIHNYRKKAFIFVFLILFVVTISWEIFELVGKITFWADKGYLLDNFGDILNAYLGGMIAYFFFIKNKKCCIKLAEINNNIIK